MNIRKNVTPLSTISFEARVKSIEPNMIITRENRVTWIGFNKIALEIRLTKGQRRVNVNPHGIFRLRRFL